MELPIITANLFVHVVDKQRKGLTSFNVTILKGECVEDTPQVVAKPSSLCHFFWKIWRVILSFLSLLCIIKKKRLQETNQTTVFHDDTQVYGVGQMQQKRLEPYVLYCIIVKAEGYEKQKREIVLQPGNNSIVFFMGAPGSRYYYQGGVKIPFEANEKKVLVLAGKGENKSQELLLQILAEHTAFKIIAIPPTTSANLLISEINEQGKSLPVKPWHIGLVWAELEITASGEARKAAIANLQEALQKQPNAGRLAVILNENEKGGAMYIGVIELTMKPGFQQVDIDRICSKYKLRYLQQQGWRLQFEVIGGPDVDFDVLLERILKEEKALVAAAEPVLEHVMETDARVVPQNFLFPLQWDHEIIQTPEAWSDLETNIGAANKYGSNTVVIAVADPDGVDTSHPSLTSQVGGVPKMLGSFDFLAPGAMVAANVTSPHGTCCAGAATSNADNVYSANPTYWEGTAGSAPGCRLIATKIGANDATMYRWFMGLNVGAAPTQLAIPVDVASNSYGHSAPPAVITAAEIIFLDFASDFGRMGRGIVMCYSAGNANATILPQRPLAAYNRTICVTATTLNNNATIENRVGYSNVGIEADVCTLSDNWANHHAPPASYGAVTITLTSAIAIPITFGDRNLPAAPDRVGVVDIHDTVNANTAVNSPIITLTTSNAPFIGTSAILVEGVNSPKVEGLQMTGLVAGPPPNRINVRYGSGFANTQQSHNAGVRVIGGTADYTSNFSGTSYATPVTAGLTALLLSAKPTLTWVEVRHILRTTSRKVNAGETDVNGRWRDKVGGNQVLNGALNDVVAKTPAVSTTLAANAAAPADPLWHKNFGTSVITLTNAAGFEVGDVIHIRQGVKNDFRVIEAIGVMGQVTIDALQNSYTTAGTTVTAGKFKPGFSQFYGYGRINAVNAVKAARLYNHAHRDLVIRNTITDTGLVDVIAPATQIQSPDIWIRNQADPAMPAPAYDQPGLHQNPDSTVDRYIYVRIKNIGIAETNLDAWVHFYVALSDHAAPPSDPFANPAATQITTPFLFPGDVNSTTVGISAKSWCDEPNNEIGLPAPNGIISGTQKVYHVSVPAPAIPNQLIPAGTIAKADSNNINTGVTVVRIQWNQLNLPPVGTNLGIYLLAYVSPVDGERQGREAGRNNNMSYREIAFAEFNLLDSLGVVLASSVNVDAFGTPVETDFAVQMNQTIGSITVDRVTIEINRTSSNGSVESAVFRNNAGVWGLFDALGNPAALTWLSVNAPVITGSANPAAALETNISFAGKFSCALQHHKVTFKAVINSARPGATLVPIAEESFDVMVIADVPETPSAASTDPAPPIPDSYAFTDFGLLTAQPNASKSFGPIDNDKFRITSVFTASGTPKAYAVCAGVVMVQVVDANRVNLILRPLKQAGLGMTPVKYYIYRGLRRDDFFNNDNTLVRNAAGAKDFIGRLWPIFLGQNAGPPPFPAEALGWDPATQNPTTKIDDYFFATGGNFQYALAKPGEYLADFYREDNSSEFGFEIVLEEGTAQPTIANVQLSEYIVDASTAAVGANEFNKRLAKEEILNYLDPAAFYGMHFDGTVRRTPSGTWTGADIVTNVVDKFFTKRCLYLDIRNENGNSYNFYQNYKGLDGQPDTGKNLRHGKVTGGLTPVTYGANGWPIQILQITHNSATATNPLVINLRWDDNRKPVLYVEHGTITSANINKRFADETHLFVQPPYVEQWTNDITFTSPNTGAGPNKDSIAWVIKLHYSRMIDAATVWPDGVVKTQKTTDNLFGPIDLDAPWGLTDAARWISAQDRKYVDGQALGFGQMMERGVAYEGDALTGRVIMYAALLDQHRNIIPGFIPRRGITGGVSDGISFLQAARNFDQYRLQFGSALDGVTNITTLKFVPGAVVNAGSANAVMFLGISADQLNTLRLLPGLNNNYPRTVFIEEIAPFGTGKKCKLGVQGLQADGTSAIAMPTAGNEIFVYTLEGLFFYSDKFSSDEPLPTTYTRNAEEAIGLMDLPIGAGNFLIHGVTPGANGNFRVAGDLSQLISKGGQFQIAANPNNNGTYTVISVTYASGANVTTLQVANVPGASTSGTLQLLPRAIEEHFVSMDPFVPITGNAAMKTIVDGFAAAVNATVNDANARATLEGHIDNYGKFLLDRARAAVRDVIQASPDDRPLYWARIKMMVILKSHELLLQKVAEGAALIKRLDERTRGIAPAPNFGAAAGKKKVLVIGFDPFFLIPTQAGHNTHQSNPSGVAALFLHGATEIPGMFIQSVIIPVRYEDFDTGVVDRLVEPYLHGANAVDMILSVSQDIDLRFHVDRFGTRFRTLATPDNAGVRGKTPVHFELNAVQNDLITLASNVDMPRILETNLPAEMIVPGSRMPVAAIGAQIVKTVIFDQKFTPTAGAEVGVDNINTYSGDVPPAGVEIEQGSGGNYLSNEVFYRIAWRRTQRASTIKTGHLHVPKLQRGTMPAPSALFNKAMYQYFVDTMVQILKDTLPGI